MHSKYSGTGVVRGSWYYFIISMINDESSSGREIFLLRNSHKGGVQQSMIQEESR